MFGASTFPVHIEGQGDVALTSQRIGLLLGVDVQAPPFVDNKDAGTHRVCLIIINQLALEKDILVPVSHLFGNKPGVEKPARNLIETTRIPGK